MLPLAMVWPFPALVCDHEAALFWPLPLCKTCKTCKTASFLVELHELHELHRGSRHFLALV